MGTASPSTLGVVIAAVGSVFFVFAGAVAAPLPSGSAISFDATVAGEVFTAG